MAKLKCIRATSTNDVSNIYDDSACLGASEEIKMKLTLEQITEITIDINKLRAMLSQVARNNEDEIEVRREHGITDEFENKIMMTTILEDVDVIITSIVILIMKPENRNNLRFIHDKHGNTKQETHTTHSEEEASE